MRLNSNNDAQSTLADGISDSDTALEVTDASSFPAAPFAVKVENEYILVETVNGNVFSDLTRGYEGSPPTAHPQGSGVENVFTAGTRDEDLQELDNVKRDLIAHEAEVAKMNIIKKDLLIESANWVDDTENSGYWICTVTDADVTSDSVVDVAIHLSSIDDAGDLLPVTQSANGSFTLYATDQPTEDINADYRITNELAGEE